MTSSLYCWTYLIISGSALDRVSSSCCSTWNPVLSHEEFVTYLQPSLNPISMTNKEFQCIDPSAAATALWRWHQTMWTLTLIYMIIKCHQMETFSALLAICAGKSPATGEFPAQRPVTRGFDVFFDLRLNKPLSKQWWGWWFETLSRPLWRHCNEVES